jgi:foldase protein PrsA
VSKLIRSIAALGAVFFAAAGIAACGSSGVPGNAVVSVNGQPITKDAYTHWLAVAAASSAATLPGQKAPKPVVPEPPAYTACIAHLKAIEPKPAKGQQPKTEAQLKTQCEQQYKALQQQVLGFLISSEWVLGEAKELGVKVTDKEVANRLNQLKKQQFPKEAEFQKFLVSTGQTVSDLLLRVKLSMVSQKIQEKISKGGKKNVSEAEVTKYYNEHKSQFGQPEKRSIRIILTKTEAQAKQAKSEIESGKSFASVAKGNSIDPTSKNNGGELPGVVKGQEEKSLDTAIFSAQKGVLGGPVKTPFGYYIYEVRSITPATQQSFAQVQAQIKQQLAAQGQQQALTKFVKEFKEKWKGRTECRSEYVVQDCKQYKAPKTPAGVPTTPAG